MIARFLKNSHSLPETRSKWVDSSLKMTETKGKVESFAA